jgi:hypothetical protein
VVFPIETVPLHPDELANHRETEEMRQYNTAKALRDTEMLLLNGLSLELMLFYARAAKIPQFGALDPRKP